jgi:hypothetical protein
MHALVFVGTAEALGVDGLGLGLLGKSYYRRLDV